jgi:acetyl esterase/lipase
MICRHHSENGDAAAMQDMVRAAHQQASANAQRSLAEIRRSAAARADQTIARKVIEGSTVVPVVINDVQCERIMAPCVAAGTALIYCHGGGYVMGSLKLGRALASHLSAASGCEVISVGYRQAPEHPFPAALNDVLNVFHRLVGDGLLPSNIILAGDSAGGGLMVAAAVALRDDRKPLPAGILVMSPWVDLTMRANSVAQYAHRDTVGPAQGLVLAKLYLGEADPRNPLASPVFADLAGLPPLHVTVGGAEALYDDAMALTENARASGVDATAEIYAEMPHNFVVFDIETADRAIARIGTWIRGRMQVSKPSALIAC